MTTSQDKSWITDSFSIRKMCVEYVDSHFEAKELLESMQHYEVSYDPDITASGDAIVVRMHAKINADSVFPGYRIESIVQIDYLLANHEGEVTSQQVAPEDLEFFLNDIHESLQDHILEATEYMPLGSYLLPPLDLQGTIGDQIKDFLGGA